MATTAKHTAVAVNRRGPVDAPEPTPPAAPELGPVRSYQAAEVSEALHRSTKWVYRHADELGAIRIGRAVIFPRHRIDAIAGERAA
jgi:hypothetical protein